MTTHRKIIAARITPMPRPMPVGMFDPMPEVHVTFDDGTQTQLFTYYPDELSFTAEEFLGLTEQEARDLRRRKDIDYLRS